jgi:hypothetical protein
VPRYILNSAVITAPGRYEYRLVTPDEARAWYTRVSAGETARRKVVAALAAGDSLSAIARRMGITRERVAALRDRAPEPAPLSTIGYPETAAAVGMLLGVTIPVDRRTIAMLPGDEALVFRLALPPGSRRIDPADKGRIGQEILAGHYELGLLTRLA